MEREGEEERAAAASMREHAAQHAATNKRMRACSYVIRYLRMHCWLDHPQGETPTATAASTPTGEQMVYGYIAATSWREH